MISKKSLHPLINEQILNSISKKNNFIIMSEIGHGGYSKVYSIKFINKGIFALKLIILDKKIIIIILKITKK